MPARTEGPSETPRGITLPSSAGRHRRSVVSCRPGGGKDSAEDHVQVKPAK